MNSSVPLKIVENTTP